MQILRTALRPQSGYWPRLRGRLAAPARRPALAATAVNAALIVLLLCLAGWFTRLWLREHAADRQWSPAASAPLEPVPAASNTPDIGSIADARLFGAAQTAAAPDAADAAAAPETSLNLQLLGILAADSRHPAGSRALIAGGEGDERSYAVGDAVAPGITLQSVLADRVVIRRGGKLESLSLDKDRNKAVAAIVGGPAAAVDDSADDEADAGADATDNGEAEVQSLAEVQSAVQANPQTIAHYLNLQPAVTIAGAHGFRVSPGNNGSVFNGTGLHPGDIVTAVNGVALSPAESAEQLLSRISADGGVSVTAERFGHTQTFHVDGAQ